MLSRQIPCGDGDGDLEAAEQMSVRPATSDAPFPAAAMASIRVISPARGRLRAVVDAGRRDRVQIDLADVRGRIVRRLHSGPTRGPFEIEVSESAGQLPAGVYFFRVTTADGVASSRAVLLR